MNRKKFETYTPPGVAFWTQLKFCLGGLGVAIAWSISYLIKYSSAHANLYEYTFRGRVLKSGIYMIDFQKLVHSGIDSFDGFLVFYFMMVGMLVYHYLYYYQGSKSIYLMRRLPNRWEVHRRSITLPFAAFVIAVMTEIALWLLYYGIYLVCTPAQCLPLY